MPTETTWTMPGADGELIYGNCHHAAGQAAGRAAGQAVGRAVGDARGVVLIAHGFKGYKDYGMFPRIARTFADAGFIAHRFNFSHSGMTDRTETFERPDLFERDTWNRQVFDLRATIDAVRAGRLDGAGLPLVLFGHSRGGVTVLLTAGRGATDDSFDAPAGIITASAPSTCNSLTPEHQSLLLSQGYLESPSSRTGQALRVGRAALQEQLDDPAGHDLLALAGQITCPVGIAHGRADPTVPESCAVQIGRTIGERVSGRATIHIVDGADHVFNTPNPLPDDAEPSPQLRELLDQMTRFAVRVTA